MPRPAKVKSHASSGEPYVLKRELDDSNQLLLGFSTVTPASDASSVARNQTGSTGRYDKKLLVSLVCMTTSRVDWDNLGSRIGKTATQCKDVWRKVIYPALTSNQSWTTSGKGWTEEMKKETMLAVLNSISPDWEAIAVKFPGKSKTRLEVHDVWRKVVMPRLNRGQTIQ
ncbi:hypothetical protein IAU60_002127 [Kwoniella sp. DSM 27419]